MKNIKKLTVLFLCAALFWQMGVLSPVFAAEKLTIQEMIDKAEDGDTIKVPKGNYKEDIVVDKSVKLKGNNTTIEGTVKITADNVRFESFTLTKYGVNDGDPVVRILGKDAKVSSNKFLKTEDAVEVLVEGNGAKIRNNIFRGIISTDSGMLYVKESADNAKISDNEFLGGPGGQWGLLQIFSSSGKKTTAEKNKFRNASDKAVFVGGEDGILKFNKNKFGDGSGVIFISKKPKSLNGLEDFYKAEEKVEDKNSGAEVVYGFKRDTKIQKLIDAADKGDTINVPSGIYEENLSIKKSVRLIGKNVTLNGKITVLADNVSISKFRFMNGINDEEPVIKIEAKKAKIFENMFDTTQDAVEILVDGADALVEKNTIYSGAAFERTWRMVLVTGKGNNTKIRSNSFIGSSSHGIFTPILLTAIKDGQTVKIEKNIFSGVASSSISVIGKGINLTIKDNNQELRNIVINDKPKSLNGYKDLEKGAKDIEKRNPGADVVFDF